MGQLITRDSYPSLTKNPHPTNSTPIHHPHPLKTLPNLQSPYYKILHRQQTPTQIHQIYKFLPNHHISITLKKKQPNPITQPHPIGNQMMYGYKIKYRYRSQDKIKNILWKKRLYGGKEDVLDILAELKLLAGLEVGAYMGVMIDGADGHLMDGYAEYYSENLVKFKTNCDKLIKKLNSVFLNVDKQCTYSTGFSIFNHQTVLKLQPPQKHPNQVPPQQPPLLSPKPQSQLTPISSLNIKISSLQDKYSKQVKAIDEKTCMLSAIENCLTHKNIEKAVILYEDTLRKFRTPAEKMRYIYQFVGFLEDCGEFRGYLDQVINQALDSSQLDYDDEEGINYRKQLQQKACFIKLSSKEFSSQNEVQQFSQNYSAMDRSSLQKQLLKLNIQQSNKQRIKQLIKQMNKSSKLNKTISVKNEKYSNKGKYGYQEDQQEKEGQGEEKENQEINYQYAVMLMKSGKSRLALILFQFLLRNQEVSAEIKYKICNFMALIYYYRGYYSLARAQFEKALIRIIRMNYYCSKITLAYNNIGCTFYNDQNYQRALQIFTYALAHDYGNNDYHSLLRNNRALTYLKLGQLKQAKQQFMLIVNRGQPLNNSAILCKIYSNMGYMNMRANQYSKAKDDFKLAIEIQEKCLLPNGHRPSPFLHNNYAMTIYKLRLFRQALDHFSKYFNQFQQLKSIQGVMINFNIARVYKQCYKNQGAKYHIEKCRRLLATSPEKFRKLYQKKIDQQAENIVRDNIDEVSDQSSGAVLDNMMSIFSRKMEVKQDIMHNRLNLQ